MRIIIFDIFYQNISKTFNKIVNIKLINFKNYIKIDTSELFSQKKI